MLLSAIKTQALKIASVAFCLLVLIPCAHAVPCSVNINNTSVNLSWTREFGFQKVDFIINKTNSEACVAEIGVSRGNSPTFSRYATFMGHNFDYQVYQDTSFSTPLKDGIDISSPAEAMIVSFDVGQTSRTLSYYIKAPPPGTAYLNFMPAGNYIDNFLIHTYDPSDLTTPLSTSTVNLTLTVNQIMQLSLVPVGFSFDSNSLSQTLDLGNLEYSRHGEVDLLVQSNVSYDIKVSSLNGGKLVNTTSHTGNNQIPYNFKINNSPVGITTIPTSVSLSNPITSTSGDANRLSVDTTQASDVSVGTYSDTIKITIDLSQ